MPSRRKAKIPRSDDPLGFGLKSIPVSLQRLWLIQQGNPYFEDDATEVRAKLAIPAGGFTDAASYVDWSATRWKRHGHEAILPFFLSAGRWIAIRFCLYARLNADWV